MIITAVLAFGLMGQEVQPILWLNPSGEISIEGKKVTPKISEGVFRRKLKNGVAYDFSGKPGGILFGDPEALQLQGSMTVSVWLHPRSHVIAGPGSQILFRGDDRLGMDSFNLAITHDGTINFGVGYEDGKGMSIKGELPLNKWTHVFANYDVENGEMNLWLDYRRAGYCLLTGKMLTVLERDQTPGVSVGNVQNDTGVHNQPYNGVIADLRVYNKALTPEELRMSQRPWQIDAISSKVGE